MKYLSLYLAAIAVSCLPLRAQSLPEGQSPAAAIAAFYASDEGVAAKVAAVQEFKADPLDTAAKDLALKNTALNAALDSNPALKELVALEFSRRWEAQSKAVQEAAYAKESAYKDIVFDFRNKNPAPAIYAGAPPIPFTATAIESDALDALEMRVRDYAAAVATAADDYITKMRVRHKSFADALSAHRNALAAVVPYAELRYRVVLDVAPAGTPPAELAALAREAYVAHNEKLAQLKALENELITYAHSRLSALYPDNQADWDSYRKSLLRQ